MCLICGNPLNFLLIEILYSQNKFVTSIFTFRNYLSLFKKMCKIKNSVNMLTKKSPFSHFLFKFFYKVNFCQVSIFVTVILNKKKMLFE